MIVERHPSFVKSYKKRIVQHPALVKRVKERLLLFVQNSQSPLLYDHPLKGSKQGARAFSVNGDIRIVYKRIDETTVRLVDIGSHNQVYK